MPLVVRIPGPLRSYTQGAGAVRASGHTLAEVLEDLDRQFPGIRFRFIDEQQRIRPHMRIFVNQDLACQLDHRLRDTDQVHVLCALSGG
jgi:molybdopterin converting factor small subunit